MNTYVRNFLNAATHAFFAPWLLMIFIGILHSYLAAIPAVGYWFCFWLLFAVWVVASVAGRAAKTATDLDAD